MSRPHLLHKKFSTSPGIYRLEGGGGIKSSHSLFGSHFFIVHSNYLTSEYCESIWLTIKHVKFDMEGVGYGVIKPFGPVGNVWEHPPP